MTGNQRRRFPSILNLGSMITVPCLPIIIMTAGALTAIIMGTARAAAGLPVRAAQAVRAAAAEGRTEAFSVVMFRLP